MNLFADLDIVIGPSQEALNTAWIQGMELGGCLGFIVGFAVMGVIYLINSRNCGEKV